MGNDLGGVAKDLKDGWLNLVLLIAERRQLPLSTAFAAVVEAHNADVLAFERWRRACRATAPRRTCSRPVGYRQCATTCMVCAVGVACRALSRHQGGRGLDATDRRGHHLLTHGLASRVERVCRRRSVSSQVGPRCTRDAPIELRDVLGRPRPLANPNSFWVSGPSAQISSRSPVGDGCVARLRSAIHTRLRIRRGAQLLDDAHLLRVGCQKMPEFPAVNRF